MFYEIVRKLPEGSQVILETGGDRAVMSIRAGRSRFTLQTPAGKRLFRPRRRRHGAQVLAAGGRSAQADQQDPVRDLDRGDRATSLNGIYLHTVGSGKKLKLRAVATDGHRLAQVDFDAPAGADGMPGVIVPRKTVGEVQRLIEDGDNEVQIELSPAKIRVTVGARRTHLKADRRNIPGLRPRHSGRQRQAPRSREEGVRAGGRPRLDGIRASAAAR